LAPAREWRDFILGGLLLLLLCGVGYFPSLSGQWIWDDPDYVVNNPNLRGLSGLIRTWTDLQSLPQWYPVVHTTFWVEYQLAGLNPLIYRVNNLLLHAFAAVLLWRILRRLQVPGSYLAAVVFAVHPVHVESVAWITERKNTLTLFFYLLAAWFYLRSVHWLAGEPVRPSRREWMISGVLFVLALLSKTVTASFPAAMLLLHWWKQGSVRWSIVRPLIPFFVLGLLAGSITGWLERVHVGARGHEWVYGSGPVDEFVARSLIAGRAIWFYAGKIVWPSGLSFMYERWNPADRSLWSFALLFGAVLLPILAVLLRHRIGRGPACGLLFFGGTLLPALSFVNVYPHRYSFVADHFQHLASLGLIVLLAGWVGSACQRLRPLARIDLERATTVAVAIPLLLITRSYSAVYQDEGTVWEHTVRRVPNSWVAHTRLGVLAAGEGRTEDAIRYHEEALRLRPEAADPWYNIGSARMMQNRVPEARAAFHKALELSLPRTAVHVETLVALGKLALYRDSDLVAATRWLSDALQQHPYHAEANFHMGVLLDRQGQREQAIVCFRRAVQQAPEMAEAHEFLGSALARAQSYPEAAGHFQQVVRINPENANAWRSLGYCLVAMGKPREAQDAFLKVLRLVPGDPGASRGLDMINSRSQGLR
jgi:tetratricopeptide (TPR) repeat protein